MEALSIDYTHDIHEGIFTYISHKNQPNVGKYTIHVWYGILYRAFIVCVTIFTLLTLKKNLKKNSHIPTGKMPTNRKVTGGHLPLLSWSLPMGAAWVSGPPCHGATPVCAPRCSATAPGYRSVRWGPRPGATRRRRRVRRRQAAGDARLNRRCRAPPPHPPKSSCHQSCLVFNVFCFVHVVSFKNGGPKNVFGNMLKKRSKKVIGFHETRGILRRNLAIRKRSANYRLIVTGIGIELCKESGCSTSWFLISSQILDVRWLFIILTFSSALWQCNI